MGRHFVLELTLKGPRGERYTVANSVSEDVASEMLEPQKPLSDFLPGSMGFEEAVSILRRREFRKDLLIKHAQNLGCILAERLEDHEGWHGADRKERLDDWPEQGGQP